MQDCGLLAQGLRDMPHVVMNCDVDLSESAAFGGDNALRVIIGATAPRRAKTCWEIANNTFSIGLLIARI